MITRDRIKANIFYNLKLFWQFLNNKHGTSGIPGNAFANVFSRVCQNTSYAPTTSTRLNEGR